MENEQVIRSFDKTFPGFGKVQLYFAPGRVNLIGEHIDYNGGHVFPCALTAGTYLAARKRKDNKIFFYSENYKKGGVIERSLDELVFQPQKTWTNYPMGSIWALNERGIKLPCGFDIYVYGNIPGSGLSSSASMEVVTLTMLNDMCALKLTPVEIAQIAQRGENGFNGCNCGIMDQFASAMGKADCALFLDCATLNFEYVPLILKGYKIVVSNSNKPHSLTSSHYNDRRAECEKALAILQSAKPGLNNLCSLSLEELESCKNLFDDEIIFKRAKHAVSEEERTKKAVKALKDNDLVLFGALLNESGDSLHYDYDATCYEIDCLVEAARKQEGVLGSRETGGGWGGNTVSIVKDEAIDSFRENVKREYKEKTKLNASISVLEVGEGARRLQ